MKVFQFLVFGGLAAFSAAAAQPAVLNPVSEKDRTIIAPVAAGDRAGTITVTYRGKTYTVYSEPAVSSVLLAAEEKLKDESVSEAEKEVKKLGCVVALNSEVKNIKRADAEDLNQGFNFEIEALIGDREKGLTVSKGLENKNSKSNQ